jgi:hypothetical protein
MAELYHLEFHTEEISSSRDAPVSNTVRKSDFREHFIVPQAVSLPISPLFFEVIEFARYAFRQRFFTCWTYEHSLCLDVAPYGKRYFAENGPLLELVKISRRSGGPMANAG